MYIIKYTYIYVIVVNIKKAKSKVLEPVSDLCYRITINTLYVQTKPVDKPILLGLVAPVCMVVFGG